MSRFLVSAVAAATLLLLTPARPASGIGTTYDKLAYLTFSAPVQVPGATLRAGTYRFHLTNPDTSRSVLQVLSNDGAIVHAMFNTIPDRRTSPTDEAAVTFRETPAGVPPAVRTLFYGGEYGGYEFVYPKGGPNMIPDAIAQPEITYTATPLPAAPVEAPVEEVEAVQPAPAVEPVAAAIPEQVPATEPELPRTASALPFIAAGGLGSLLVGLGLGLLRRRAG
jgi:hypothetical protein